MRHYGKEFLLVKVADEAQVAAHCVKSHVALTLDRSIAITQFPEQGLHNLFVRNAMKGATKSLPKPLRRRRGCLIARFGMGLVFM